MEKLQKILLWLPHESPWSNYIENDSTDPKMKWDMTHQQNNEGKRFFVSMKNINLRLTIR